MKHVIIGTAGHVDHGKTLLVRALTGIDTDRLIEEKKRGITIELGFAHLSFPDGTQAGIIDVPGHEKFIKNMLAGAGGIDLAMLVVAADEGFMPQTIEHLDILSLLGMKDGLVVITKSDMVDPAWLDMIREDVKSKVEGTFLEGKPVYAVSAYTGEGIPELKEALGMLVARASEKNLRIPFRLPVDRVFSMEGFGTIVTGTLVEGCIREEETVQLMPSGVTAKVRNLQVHGKAVTAAYAGQRVAINLAGLKKSDIRRGDAVVAPDSMQLSMMLDVRLRNLKNSRRTILNYSQVHFHHGAGTMLAKVVLLDRESLKPGDSCYAQLRLSGNIAAKPGDRFVIRFFSPLETIGGGVILDEAPRKHKAGDRAAAETLKIRENGSGDQKLVQAIASENLSLASAEKLEKKFAVEPEELRRDLQRLIGKGEVLELLPGRYLAASVLDRAMERCESLLGAYHAANPLHAGMKLAELRQKLFAGVELAVADGILKELLRTGKVKQAADRYALAEFEVRLTKRQSTIREKMLQIYRNAGLDVPSVDDMLAMFLPKEKDDCRQVFESLVSGGELVILSPQIVVHGEVYRRIHQTAKAWFAEHETLTLAEFRDLLHTSRKYALAALEYFDRKKMTKKDGDFRRATAVLLSE